MPETLVMVTRVDLTGGAEAEPVAVTVDERGWCEFALDDGVLLRLDPANAAVLRRALEVPVEERRAA